MDPAHVHCRDYGHSWGPFRVKPIAKGFERTVRCKTCGATQEQLLNARGDIIKKPGRRYPEGYLVKGLGRLTGEDKGYVRLASIADTQGGQRG